MIDDTEEHGLCWQQLWRLTFFHASRLKLGIHDCLRLLSRRRLIASSPSGEWARGCDPAGKAGHGAGGGGWAWRAGEAGSHTVPGSVDRPHLHHKRSAMANQCCGEGRGREGGRSHLG